MCARTHATHAPTQPAMHTPRRACCDACVLALTSVWSIAACQWRISVETDENNALAPPLKSCMFCEHRRLQIPCESAVWTATCTQPQQNAAVGNALRGMLLMCCRFVEVRRQQLVEQEIRNLVVCIRSQNRRLQKLHSQSALLYAQLGCERTMRKTAEITQVSALGWCGRAAGLHQHGPHSESHRCTSARCKCTCAPPVMVRCAFMSAVPVRAHAHPLAPGVCPSQVREAVPMAWL